MTGGAMEAVRRHRSDSGGGTSRAAESARLAHHAGQDLEWARKSWWQGAWTLRAGDVEIVHLDSVNWWSTTLAAELDGERLLFGRSLWRDTAVRERDGAEVGRLHRTGLRRDEDSVRLEMSRWWGTGRLEYAGGERAWLKRAPWRSRWTLLDDRGRELATISRIYRSFTASGAMRLTPLAAERRSLALLLTFAWWIVSRELARQRHSG